jgi:hypothetical protein
VSSRQAVVVMSPEELTALMKAAVSEALAEQREDCAPILLDRNGLAKAFRCSPSQIDRLRRLGLPFIRLGDVPRFELSRCLEWLHERTDVSTTDA